MSSNAVMKIVSPLYAMTTMTTFMLKLFPRLPSGPVDLFTRPPRVHKVRYPTLDGWAEGDLYLPSWEGRHRAVVVCLGVVPFGINHPQVPRLGEALARAGFAALLYWSPAMRDLRLDPADAENIALAYEWLLDQPWADPARSGLLGTCVGASFALLAAARPRIRHRVAFIAAYAPFASLPVLIEDAASGSTLYSLQTASVRAPWQVDQLTRRVLIRALTAELAPAEAEHLRTALDDPSGTEPPGLSSAGRRVYSLLSHPDVELAGEILEQLPPSLLDRLAAMSPLNFITEVQAPLIILLHDSGDTVIPVGQSRCLRDYLARRPGFHYREMQFQHLNPARLPVWRLVSELSKFYRALLPLFQYSYGKKGRKRDIENCAGQYSGVI